MSSGPAELVESPSPAPVSVYGSIFTNALWKQNPGLVQLLGLCPTLAMTNNLVNGLSLGVMTAIVMAASNAAVSPVRRLVPSEIRIPVFILIIAALVTIIDLSMHAYLHTLHGVLGIFIPLIVTNCIVLARVEAFAAKNALAPSAFDGWMMGIGLAAVLAFLGGIRELIGNGTLFSGIELVFGEAASPWVWHLGDYHGFLLAVLPPGAFLGLAGLIALKNCLDRRASSKTTASLAEA